MGLLEQCCQTHRLNINKLDPASLLFLQDVHNKLQRTEGALSVAHQELNDLKSQFVEQEEAMHELQATLDSKETLLNTISMAACECLLASCDSTFFAHCGMTW